jgi:hypothetical protein
MEELLKGWMKADDDRTCRHDTSPSYTKFHILQISPHLLPSRISLAIFYDLLHFPRFTAASIHTNTQVAKLQSALCFIAEPSKQAWLLTSVSRPSWHPRQAQSPGSKRCLLRATEFHGTPGEAQVPRRARSQREAAEKTKRAKMAISGICVAPRMVVESSGIAQCMRTKIAAGTKQYSNSFVSGAASEAVLPHVRVSGWTGNGQQSTW